MANNSFIISSETVSDLVFEHFTKILHDETGIRPHLNTEFQMKMTKWLHDCYRCKPHYLKSKETGFWVLSFEFKNREDFINFSLTFK